MEKLIFSPDFEIRFNWRGHVPLHVGSVRPENRNQIAEGLQYMSNDSIRNRFLAAKRAFSEEELRYLTCCDGWNHYAIGVEEQNDRRRGVAIIRLVRSLDSKEEAEVAITIIDEFQNQGLGRFLMDLIILAAKEREIDTLSFTFLPQNEAIMKLIRKYATPLKGAQTKDYVQQYLKMDEIDTAEIKHRLKASLPEIKGLI